MQPTAWKSPWQPPMAECGTRCAGGNTLLQALLLGAMGCALSAGADLLGDGAVLRNREAVLRDLEMQPIVRVLSAGEVMERVHAGTAILLDGRPAADFARLHLAGSLPFRPESSPMLGPEVEEMVLGADVIVVLPAEAVEEARRAAQDLILYHGAASTATVKGGFEALHAAGLEVEGTDP